MASRLTWKSGFEIELMAPPGASRLDLALRVARRTGGSVRRYFHPQSEPSKVPGQPVFENLTLGFEVLDRRGARTAAFVDDLTLQLDLDRERDPAAGWHRVLGDDPRILRLAIRHCDAAEGSETVLDPLAALFGTKAQPHEGGIVRVVDETGASVAICAPLPGERERPCEIVTAPIERNHARVLGELLADARRLGFDIPIEGATHIHFDAGPLCSAPVLAALVRVLDRHRDGLRNLVGVNVNCIRLGAWPEALTALVNREDFLAMDWGDARAVLAELPLTKYCDFNLCNLVGENPDKHTFEVRILPASLEVEPILAAAGLFEAILTWCVQAPGEATPETFAGLLETVPLSDEARTAWLARDRAAIWTPAQNMQS